MGLATYVVGGDLARRDVVSRKDGIRSAVIATMGTSDQSRSQLVSDLLNNINGTRNERDAYDKPFSKPKASLAVMLSEVFCVKAHRCPWHPICSPGLNESPDGMFPTISMRPLRLPPRSPMSHNALPRQLMPRAVTEVAPDMMEKRTLRRIVEDSDVRGI